MADYITSTTASLQSSPSRKRTRESHTKRTSSNLSPHHKTAASVKANVELMDVSKLETTAPLPSSTQPQISINSVRKACSNGIAGSSSGIQNHSAITVSIILLSI